MSIEIIRRTVFGFILLLACSGARTAPLLPEHEWRMIRQIAANYRLSEEETWLLAGIRRLENGRPGLEFGVGGPMDSGHRSHRFTDGVKSFMIQGSWAAGTIKRRYKGDLDAFGRRYCPPNAICWTQRLRCFIAALKAENPDRLSGK